MAKPKKKLTSAQRAFRRKRRKETMIIFINGKQKRVPRPPTLKEFEEEERMLRSADPIWLLQNGMYEYLDRADDDFPRIFQENPRPDDATAERDYDIPF
ncbi:MAG: hypothetical protein AB7I37_08280 [Pirellulales bacterium]